MQKGHSPKGMASAYLSWLHLWSTDLLGSHVLSQLRLEAVDDGLIASGNQLGLQLLDGSGDICHNTGQQWQVPWS